jgi:hypothetical protein
MGTSGTGASVGLLVGVDIGVGVGVPVPQAARKKITTIARVIFKGDIVPSLYFHLVVIRGK